MKTIRTTAALKSRSVTLNQPDLAVPDEVNYTFGVDVAASRAGREVVDGPVRRQPLGRAVHGLHRGHDDPVADRHGADPARRAARLDVLRAIAAE